MKNEVKFFFCHYYSYAWAYHMLHSLFPLILIIHFSAHYYLLTFTLVSSYECRWIMRKILNNKQYSTSRSHQYIYLIADNLVLQYSVFVYSEKRENILQHMISSLSKFLLFFSFLFCVLSGMLKLNNNSECICCMNATELEWRAAKQKCISCAFDVVSEGRERSLFVCDSCTSSCRMSNKNKWEKKEIFFYIYF